MKKNLLSLLLVLTMMLTFLAGCGSGSDAPASGTDSVSAPVEEEASVEAEAPAEEPEAPAEEAPAEEVSAEEAVEERTPITYPLVEEPVTLTYWQAWPPFLNDISSPGDAAMFEQLEEITGVHLDIVAVSTETSADDFMLRCASMDLTDLIQKGASNYTGGGAKAIEDEILVDLLPLLEEYSYNYLNLMNSDPNIYRNLVNDEGQVPALFGMYTDYYYTDQGFWIREDILEDVGKEIPTTIAELDDVLAAFKDHGLTDGLIVLSEGNCDLISRAYGAVDKMSEDGKTVEFAALSDEYKQTLQKLHEYYEKGYISVDFVTYNESDTKPPEDVVYSDMGGIFNEDVASISGYYAATGNPNFKLTALGQVRADADAVMDYGYIGVKTSDKYTLSMSTQCSDPELAIKYMDFLFSDEGFMLGNWGTEGLTYEEVNGEYQFTDLILNNELGFDWQLCQSLYINPGFPCLIDLEIEQMSYNDAQKEAVDIWAAAYDSSDRTMPTASWLSYTTEESQTVAELQADIETYQEEWRLKFITGQADIDAEWDNYCATLESMGIHEIEAITQAAVERYLNK